ncbi:hemagglutinin [Flavobacterium suaedae]|uniref:Peptidoglycan hydrolase n=1 Tax=Flavobacterium suaedae TaxID=1767027 RepID=A0ABQ1JW70_9FLAO|nr:glucosaminidase domain-containing protein [Flavobacterium suaedae]GGB76189.1 hemagglutinin [Flavobacterium suaedae]
MIRKILALVVLSLLVSCGSSYTSRKKSGTKTTNTRKDRNTSRNRTRTASSGNNRNDSRSKQSETLESTSKTVVYADVVKQYIMDYKEVAKSNMANYGVPASITLAQGILESGAGRGTLCVSANNHFGIKCHTGWEGDKVYHDDDAAQECFRKYDDPADSYRDHSLFLTGRGRYASLFKLDRDDYKGWARGLKAAGYATDPRYPNKLISLIERYDLAQYDAEVLGKSYTPKQDDPVKQQPVAQTQQAGGAGTYTVEKGDTLYSISKKHNLTVDELMRLNRLSGTALSIGQVLKVK